MSVVRFERAVVVGEEERSALLFLVRSEGAPVFNPDKKRTQAALPVQHELLCRLAAFLEGRGLLRGRSLSEAVVLFSEAGCKQQPMHTDYDPDACAGADVKPMGALLALQGGTALCFGREEVVLMGEGDVVVFDGDVPHAGAAYAQDNVRVHAFLDVASVRRRPNSTYLIRTRSPARKRGGALRPRP